MESQVAVSIIIPCHNAEEYIDRAIESVLRQTYTHWEIVAVNDGSTDNTLTKLDAWKDRLGDKLHLIDQVQRGAAMARNVGIQKAQGRYIQFLDADDELLADKITRHVDMLAHSDHKWIAGSFSLSADPSHVISPRIMNTPFAFWSGLLANNMGNTCANFFKRNIFDQVSWNIKLPCAQENNLFFDLLYNGIFPVVDNQVSVMIHSENTQSISNRSKKSIEYIAWRVKTMDYIVENFTDLQYDDIYHSFHQAMRRLYRYHPDTVLREHKKYIPKSFVPQHKSLKGYLYAKLYIWCGFQCAQRIFIMFN